MTISVSDTHWNIWQSWSRSWRGVAGRFRRTQRSSCAFGTLYRSERHLNSPWHLASVRRNGNLRFDTSSLLHDPDRTEAVGRSGSCHFRRAICRATHVLGWTPAPERHEAESPSPCQSNERRYAPDPLRREANCLNGIESGHYLGGGADLRSRPSPSVGCHYIHPCRLRCVVSDQGHPSAAVLYTAPVLGSSVRWHAKWSPPVVPVAVVSHANLGR